MNPYANFLENRCAQTGDYLECEKGMLLVTKVSQSSDNYSTPRLFLTSDKRVSFGDKHLSTYYFTVNNYQWVHKFFNEFGKPLHLWRRTIDPFNKVNWSSSLPKCVQVWEKIKPAPVVDKITIEVKEGTEITINGKVYVEKK